jgi:hypothetical protein
MHGSILVLAKKKAAGPGGYFDPMQESAPMAMGPMVFQVSEGAEMPEGEDEDEKGEYDVPTADKAKGSPSMDLKSIIADLKAAAMKLDQLAMTGELGTEDEPTGEEPMPEAAPAPKAKKPVPSFLQKKEMKY